jgi:N-methylhydantoinase B
MSVSTAYDPILAQVIQRRLEVVCQEAAITLNRTSGSPIVTEGNDFSTSLIAPDGEIIAFSSYLPVHFVSSMNAIRDLLATIDLSTVERGDHFAANDPNTTAPLHSADPNVLTPIFAGDEIVAWAFSTVHVFDIGGLTPGGWIPGAYDRYGEGLIFPLVKIVSKGTWDDNFVRIYLANVRVPQSFNDLRSCVAANNTATDRFAEVVERYGVETVHDYAATNIRLTEELARRRISALPDGAYQAVDWVEYDGHGDDRLHRLSVTVTVRGDELVIDVSDSPPQLNSFSNTTRAGLLGWIVGDLIRTLFPDLPINAGITKPLRLIQAPAGTMLNPTKDAATSAGHMESGSKVMRAFHEALQKAVQLSDSPELRRRAAGLGGSVAPHNVVAGINDAGHPEIWVSLDSLGTGLGAQANVDGRDAGCYEDMTASMLLDTELEETAPALHYYRRLRPNSGGHGYRRGGMAIDTAWRLYGMDSAQLTAFSNLTRVPTRSPGGGYPGGGTGNVIFRGRLDGTDDVSILAPADVESGGEVPPSHATNLPLDGTDVVRAFCAGGSGLGDPLFREPHLVVADLENEQITADVASAVYGVALTADGTADEAQTARRRRELRAERLGTEPAREPEPMHEFRSPLRVEDGERFACNHCGEPLGPAAENWKDHASAKSWPLGERAEHLGIHLRPLTEPALRLWELCCPGCGSLLEVNVWEEGEQPLHDVRLGETTDAEGEPF